MKILAAMSGGVDSSVAAAQLVRSKAFKGTVHFVFQPAEENEGGGKREITLVGRKGETIGEDRKSTRLNSSHQI